MLFGFLGAPCSGKTTTAARLFADLKDSGYAVEFIPEQARFYIASRRVRESQNGMPKDEKLVLTDWDQSRILIQQANVEWTMSESSPSALVLADSSAINSLLYMTAEGRSNGMVKQAAEAAASRYDLLFRCPPVQPGVMYDPNRIHDFEQSLALDEKLDEVLKFVNLPAEKVVLLGGDTRFRASEALRAILNRLMDV